MKHVLTISLLLTLLTSCALSKATSPRVDYANEPVDRPTLFAEGIISTNDHSEFELAFSPDGKKVYFSRRKPGAKQKIYESEWTNGDWTTPQLAAFSTDRDETSMITPDGTFMFFGSERPIPGQPNKGNFDMNVWMMKQEGETWGTPTPLPAPINAVQAEGEQWPSSNNNFLFTNDGEIFYFTTMYRGSEAIKLYRTKFDGKDFSQPEVIDGFFDDPKLAVYSAVLSPDGQYLLFNSYGVVGAAGGEDLFVARRTGDGWTKAKPLGAPVNTANEESSPRFSRDGKYFFFSRADNLGNYEYGEWSIFYLETEFLQLDKLFSEE